jgi:hypothetical protein
MTSPTVQPLFKYACIMFANAQLVSDSCDFDQICVGRA